MTALERLTPTQQSPAPECAIIGTTTYLLGTTNKEADSGIRRTPVPNDHPSIVLEVGVSESLAQLERDSMRWLQNMPEVQMVLLVKISRPRPLIHPTFPVIEVRVWKRVLPIHSTRSTPARIPKMVWSANWTVNATPFYILLCDIFGPQLPAAYGNNDRIYLDTGGWRQRMINSYP